MLKQSLSWKRAVIGSALGLILLPGLVASIGLYLPYVFGADTVFGPNVGTVLSEGYVLSAADVHAITNLTEALEITASYGLFLALIGGIIGLISKSGKTCEE